MELEHSFSVPVPVDRAWDVLLDVERVAPCMPGASLDSVDGDNIAGRIKVKVGPIQMTYAGTAKFTERDRAAGVVKLEASGKETRGAGTASASVRSQLTADGDQTKVIVQTSLNVTGKPAQFGRGVLAEVGGKLIDIFAGNLAAMLAAEPAPPPADDADRAQAGNVAPTAGGTSDEVLPIDVLNLGTRAWSSLRKDGIQTIGDLTRRTEQQLRSLDNIGPASVADIKAKLADRGLALADADQLAATADAAPLADSETTTAADTTAADTTAADTTAGPGTAAEPPATAEPTAAGPEPAAEPEPAAGPAGPADLNGDRHAAGRHAGPDEDLAEVTPLRPAKHEAPVRSQAEAIWQPQDTEAIDLLGVAGLPVLKRAVPAVAALLAVILVLLGLRRRRSRRG